MPFDLIAPADDDAQVPLGQGPLARAEVEIAAIVGSAVQGQQRPLQAGNVDMGGNVELSLPIGGLGRPPLDDVIHGLPRRRQRTLLTEEMIVAQQTIDDVVHVVHVPNAPHAGLGSVQADVALGRLCGDRLVHQTLLQCQHFLIPRISRKTHDGIDQFAQAGIAAAIGLLAVEGEKVAFDVQGQQVFLHGHVDAATDLAAASDLAQIERHEGVGNQSRAHQGQCQDGEKEERDGFGGGAHGECPFIFGAM